MNVGGVAYKLVQFHFHAPSEERVAGKGYPMVAHLVHRSDDGKLAVFAVLLKEGKADAALARCSPRCARPRQAEGAARGFDVAGLPSRPTRATTGYTGLAHHARPAAKASAWHVLKQPVEVSKAQIESFRKHYRMNARPVQPLNDRVVEQS
jgi:carbonic anhydrase